MPSLKMMLKIFSTIVIVAGLGLVVVSGPAPQLTFNPSGTGEFDPDASANWDLKAQLAPVHNLPNETGEPTQEEIDFKNAENLARTVARPYAIDLKESPIQAPAQGGDKDADVVLFFEGFEAGVPPAGWTSIVNNPETWGVGDYAPYEGSYYASCLYDASYTGNQNEWLISPSYDLSDGTTWYLDYWWNGSYYWSVDPYPNCTLTVYISPDGGTSWMYLWSQYDEGVFTNWQWYNEQIDLTAYLAFTDVKFAIVYTGYDGAQFSVDAFGVNDAAPPPPPIGRCCYGAEFLTCDDLEQGDCDALAGHWSLGLNCTDNPCPTVPVNDDPEGAISITPGETVTGSTAAATVDCPGVLDWEAVWYRFDAPYAENDVDINYCGTVGDIYTVGIVVYEEILPLDCNAYIIASTYAFADCGDTYTNPNMQWNRLPGPATYLFPVYVDDGLKGGMDFSFDFDLVESAPLPPGGSCGDPFALSLGSGDMPYNTSVLTTCGMGNAYSNSCLGSYDGGEDFIMELTILNDMALSISLTTDASYVGFYLATDCGDAVGCLDYATSSGSSASLMGVPVTAGTYYIMVDTWPSPDCINGFVLSFDEFVPTGGDNCADPVAVKLPDDMVAGTYSDDNYTCGRGNDYSNTCLGSYDGGEDIIYELDVAGPLTVDITVTSTSSWVGLMIADACGDVDPCIATATGSGGSPGIYNVELATGFYYIMIDTWPSPACIPTFTLNISEAAGPQPGDDYSLCEPIGDVVDLAFSTTTATPDGPGTCMTSPNIWYCYTATCDGLATFSLCGSGYDTKIAVYGGTDPFVDPQLGCNDDFCGLQSQLEIGVTAGNVYLVEVGGYGSATGSGILNVSCSECPPDPNDLCGDVVPVPMTGGVPLYFSGDNTCATADMAGLSAAGYTWHAFTTTATMDFSVLYCGLSPAWGNGFIVMFNSCDYSTINYATDWDFTSCGDGNVTINWYGMPPGTYYYPVMKDPGYDAVGPYTIAILGNALSTLTIDPTSVDFGLHAQGETGTEVVDMTASGGTSDISYAISYTYGSKSLTSFGYTDLGAVETEKPYVDMNYVNPGGVKQGGDDIGSAVVVGPVPINTTGTTAGYNNDMDEACPYSGSTSPDVVYAYTPSADITVDVSLCNPGTDYDTKLYIYENSYTPGAPFACNDDECPGYISALYQLALTGGNTYYIVIDGYGGDAGNYEMTVTEYEEPDPFECPPGAVLEAEACGDDTNGGCNMATPAFEPAACGSTVCGTAWASGSTRDTDWYTVTLYETTTITLTGQANFPGMILGFVDTSDCALASALSPYVIATNAGDIVSVSREAGPGTYWIFPGMTVYEGYPCGSGANDYWFNIDCPEGPVLWLSADPNPGTVPANSTVGLNVNFDATELEEGVYNA
ncbi:MAG: choice-of-anchor J domain-containing protein, partial [bacterium]